MNPKAKQWFAQDYQAFLEHYDRTAIMAMPYMEAEQAIQPKAAKQWLSDLLVKADVAQNNDKLVFELQARNWKTQQAIPEAELNQWFDLLRSQGVHHFGYYPDDLAKQQPDLKLIRPHFSAATAPRNWHEPIHWLHRLICLPLPGHHGGVLGQHRLNVFSETRKTEPQ